MSQNGKFNITRRDALKGGSALGALALAGNALSLPFATKAVAKETPAKPNEKIVWSACTVNC
ncbi:twin-arginine translocation signal domain-containing protein, partial [Vibrio sp. 1865]